MTATSILAAFVSSAVFYAGAAAVSVPIIIHLLARRRFRRVRWAAMDFLLEAERQNRRRVRIEELILLTLRCLAAFLVGLVLARWYVQPRGLAAVLGGAARTERIVLLDDTFSTGYRSDRGTVFDEARSAVLRLCRWIEQQSPQDSLTILLASRPETPVVQTLSLREVASEDLRSRLDRLRPSERGPCLREALAGVRKLLDARGEAANAAVYVVSDFQAADWARPDESATAGASGSPAAALAGWSGGRRSLRLVLVDVGMDEVSNAGIASFVPDQPQVIAGVPARFVATVANYGRTEVSVGSLRLFVDEASQPPVPVPPLKPGQGVGVPVELVLPSPGPATITAELPDDRLAADNRRYLAVDVQRAIRVLIVGGTSEAAGAKDEAPVLAVALRPDGPVFSGVEVEGIDENALDDANLGGYHAVVLTNVYRITESSAAQLERFARAGGGVVFFLGDQVDAELYNRLFYRDGGGVLPARLGEVVEAATAAGCRFTSPDFTHPVLRGFAGVDTPFFDGILTRKFVAVFPAVPSSRPATASAPASLPATQPIERAAARVLLAYDDADRHPAMIERPFGWGHVVLFTTSADKAWTNFPDWFTYVAMMQELIQFVARPAESPDDAGSVLVGSPIVLSLEPGRFDPAATVRTPAFPDEPEATIQARLEGAEAAARLTWTNTARAGVYRFALRETGGQATPRMAVVNVDPRESALARCGEAALRESLTEVPFTFVRGDELTRDDSDDARRETWPAVLLVLAAVLMAESALAWWFGARKT